MFVPKNIKKFFALVLTALMLTVFAVPAFAATTMVTTQSVELLYGPGDEYAAIRTIYENREVKVTSTSGKYSKVYYSGVTGYILSKYLEDPAAVYEEEAVKLTGNKRYVTANLNVRAGAGTKYKVVGALKPGDVVTVVSKSGSWSKIAFGSGTAYVFSKYLSTKYVGKNYYVPGVPVQSAGDYRLTCNRCGISCATGYNYCPNCGGSAFTRYYNYSNNYYAPSYYAPSYYYNNNHASSSWRPNVSSRPGVGVTYPLGKNNCNAGLYPGCDSSCSTDACNAACDCINCILTADGGGLVVSSGSARVVSPTGVWITDEKFTGTLKKLDNGATFSYVGYNSKYWLVSYSGGYFGYGFVVRDATVKA